MDSPASSQHGWTQTVRPSSVMTPGPASWGAQATDQFLRVEVGWGQPAMGFEPSCSGLVGISGYKSSWGQYGYILQWLYGCRLNQLEFPCLVSDPSWRPLTDSFRWSSMSGLSQVQQSKWIDLCRSQNRGMWLSKAKQDGNWLLVLVLVSSTKQYKDDPHGWANWWRSIIECLTVVRSSGEQWCCWWPSY